MKQSGNVIGTVWGITAEVEGLNPRVQIDATQNDGHVFLVFNRDVPWLGLTPDAAKHLAFALLEEVFGEREEEKDKEKEGASLQELPGQAMRGAQGGQLEVADLVEKMEE
jgi:hypothetical protein